MYLNRKKEDYVMMYFKIKRFIKELGVISLYLLRGEYSLDLLLSNLICSITPLKKRFYPRLVKMPDGFKIYINDPVTITINVPDQYVLREYEVCPEFIPREGWAVLDVGAYIGLFSLRASRLVGGKGLIVAFEPNPLAWYWLKRNIALNKAKNIRALPIGLGESNGFVNLHIVTKGNIEATSMVKQHIEDKLGKEVYNYIITKVPVYRLDTLVNKGILAQYFKDRIDLVKVDIEGMELNFLKGSANLLQRGVIQRFVIEIHTDVCTEQQLLNFLMGYGYEVEKVVTFSSIKKVAYLKAKK